MELPCITPGCDGEMDWTPGVGWRCPTCGNAFTNDNVKDAYAPPPQQPEEDPFDPWVDEQRRVRDLIRYHRGGGGNSRGRFRGRKKRIPVGLFRH